ncbi:unnamed protein product [Oppiella nova]|uniref:non-specific serine/threonine protein kinase n=1 Tax=Oppiella nova TaxID=334625 RepID=A0A7R9QCT6_9ACAR|nr:unnamed protein product [Oppiella nova]CAG2163230.1 unnamed protein product [Oppiella nova]
MSKLVKKEELGKVFSLLSTLESVSPLLASLVFTFIFEWSLDFFPGLTYEVSAALMIVPLIAMTADGGLLGWGHNNKGQLGRGDTNYGVFLKPLEIDFGEHEEIVQISCGKNHALALTSSGKVYGWGDNSSGQIGVGKFTDHISTPIKVGSKYGIKNKIRFVFAGYETSFAITIDGQVYSWGRNEFEESVRYQGFQEFQTMTKLESNSIVRYKRAWIEDNQFVYIQMQFCDSNLKNILQIRNNAFNRHSSDTLIGFTEFYLLCEMFIEINNGLLYLHSLDPPIIHRDLKPENILVVEQDKNGYFVKISDFGLSVFHSLDSQTHSRDAGTEKYMAPEVKFSNEYDMKCDVFSFGLIACEMFCIDFYS